MIGTGLGWVLAAVVVSMLPRAAMGTVAYAQATDHRDPDGPG